MEIVPQSSIGIDKYNQKLFEDINLLSNKMGKIIILKIDPITSALFLLTQLDAILQCVSAGRFECLILL